MRESTLVHSEREAPFRALRIHGAFEIARTHLKLDPSRRASGCQRPADRSSRARSPPAGLALPASAAADESSAAHRAAVRQALLTTCPSTGGSTSGATDAATRCARPAPGVSSGQSGRRVLPRRDDGRVRHARSMHGRRRDGCCSSRSSTRSTCTWRPTASIPRSSCGRTSPRRSVSAIDSLHASVDGVPGAQPRSGQLAVPRLRRPAKPSRAGCARSFSLTFPAGNLFDLPAGTYAPAVADGFYLLLAPLRPGRTRSRSAAAATSAVEFTTDTTYHLRVTLR